jgi:hypothetical protein
MFALYTMPTSLICGTLLEDELFEGTRFPVERKQKDMARTADFEENDNGIVSTLKRMAMALS